LQDIDALVLMMPNPSEVRLVATNEGNGSDSRPGTGQFKFIRVPMGDLCDFLAESLGVPVIDETGLTQKYSGSLEWTSQADKVAELKEVQNALSVELGLVLVSSHQPIEMLVVEKAP